MSSGRQQRLAKAIARAGVCSRRDAERLIESGVVSVNSEPVSTPAINVSEEDEITINGNPLPKREPTRLWMLYKPVGVITSTRDHKNRVKVFDILPKTMPRVVTVGRLDINSEGLLLLTNSGELARTLELPSSQLRRQYRCRVYGRVTDEMIASLMAGITVNGVRYGSIGVKIERKMSNNTWVTVTLTEGKNREIRRVFEYFGLQVSKLIRLAFHSFKLGNLRPGEVCEINSRRVQALLSELGICE